MIVAAAESINKEEEDFHEPLDTLIEEVNEEDGFKNLDHEKVIDKKGKLNLSTKISKILKMFSYGQYRTPLYYKGASHYSSTIGGIFSLISMIVFLIFTGYTLYGVINKDYWILSERLDDIIPLSGDKNEV
jgi:hypothetical protein